MRVLVCGGRNYANWGRVRNTLDLLHRTRRNITCIIHGGAHGADTLADDWADIRDIKSFTYPADWKSHGRAAGPIRNRRMIEEGKPDLVIAFPGGRGTANMVRQAKEAGIEVIEVTAQS
jgi:hypothetical protein